MDVLWKTKLPLKKEGNLQKEKNSLEGQERGFSLRSRGENHHRPEDLGLNPSSLLNRLQYSGKRANVFDVGKKDMWLPGAQKGLQLRREKWQKSHKSYLGLELQESSMFWDATRIQKKGRCAWLGEKFVTSQH